MANDRQLQSLTGLRGIAALAVMIFHLTSGIFGAATDTGLQLLARRGYLAVDLFFILSGFVLTHVYGEEFVGRWDWSRLGQFLWARIARLYPIHLLTLLMLLRLYGQGSAYSAHAFVFNLLLLQGPWLPYANWNDPSWSLSVDWHAYLLFPLLCALVARRSMRATICVASACWLTLLAVAAAQDWGFQPIAHGALSLARSLPEFVIGILSYRLYRSGWWLPVWRSDWTVAALVALVVALAPLWPTDLAIVMAFPPLLLAVASNDGTTRLVLNCRPVAALGRMSYSLYMVHLICLDTILGILGSTPADANAEVPYPTLTFAAVFLISITMALSISRCIEYPARSFLRGLWRAPKPTSGAPITSR